MSNKRRVTLQGIRCSLTMVFEMEGDPNTFPRSAVADKLDDDIEVSSSVEISPPSIDGDYEVRVVTRSDIIIEEWVTDAQRAINSEAITDHTILDWRIEA